MAGPMKFEVEVTIFVRSIRRSAAFLSSTFGLGTHSIGKDEAIVFFPGVCVRFLQVEDGSPVRTSADSSTEHPSFVVTASEFSSFLQIYQRSRLLGASQVVASSSSENEMREFSLVDLDGYRWRVRLASRPLIPIEN